MKTNLRVSLSFISIFMLGLLGGALLRPLLPFGWNGPRGPDHRFEHRHDGPMNQHSEQEDRRMRRIEAHMRRNLELDSEQQDVLFSAIRENRREREELMERRKEEIRLEMRRQQREFELRLDSILTENQRAVWDSLYSREALRERRRD
jgi:hypothetical protein